MGRRRFLGHQGSRYDGQAGKDRHAEWVRDTPQWGWSLRNLPCPQVVNFTSSSPIIVRRRPVAISCGEAAVRDPTSRSAYHEVSVLYVVPGFGQSLALRGSGR